MLSKENLKPFYKKHLWLLPPVAFVLIIISPIVFPIYLILDNIQEIKNNYKELFNALFLNFE